MHRPTRTQPGSQQVRAQLVLRKPHVVRVPSWDSESRTCLESAHPPGYARDLQQQKRATCTRCQGGDGRCGRQCQRGERWRLKMDKTHSPGQRTLLGAPLGQTGRPNKFIGLSVRQPARLLSALPYSIVTFYLASNH